MIHKYLDPSKTCLGRLTYYKTQHFRLDNVTHANDFYPELRFYFFIYYRNNFTQIPSYNIYPRSCVRKVWQKDAGQAYVRVIY